MTENKNRIADFLKKNPVLVAGTMGLDKKPQLHRVELCYEEAGAF